MTEEVEVQTLQRMHQKQITIRNFADFVPSYPGYYQLLRFVFGDCICHLKLALTPEGHSKISIHFPPNRQFSKFDFAAWNKAEPNMKYCASCDESCHQAPLNVARSGLRCARHSLVVPLVTDITFMLTVYYRIGRVGGTDILLQRRPASDDIWRIDLPQSDSNGRSVNPCPLRVNPVVMDVSSPEPVVSVPVGRKRSYEEGEDSEAKRQK